MTTPESLTRKQKGQEIARSHRLKHQRNGLWLVPSQSHGGSYIVDLDDLSCTCPDHELRGHAHICKHRWAVEFARHRVTTPDGEVVTETMRVTYRQDWPTYNAAQCSEKDQVQVLLRALCDGVRNPVQEGRGRRRAPLNDVLFAAIMKTYVNMSGRRATSDLRVCQERGFLGKVPPYNTIFDYMERSETTPILKSLLRISATPLAGVETTFAIDATGFGSTTYDRWYDHKYGRKLKTAHWVKLHAICGVSTQVITTAEVTEAEKNDSPLLPQLVRETAETFTMERISADKGYLAVSNLEAIEAVGAEPLVCFKANSKSRGAAVWRRAYHAFAYNREEWLTKYCVRSQIESVFSSVKRCFGSSVSSKNETAMYNEVLAKCICHNLSCLVHAMHKLGLDPTFSRLEASA